jgi:hypothetical protein
MLAMTTALLRGAEVISCKPGPWGRIEYETIYLQAPDWVLDRFSMPGTQPRWSFPGATAEAVQALFARWTFDPAALKRWFEPGNCRQDEEAFTIYPTPEEVIALPAATRAALYRELSKSPLNQYHAEPAFITGTNVESWLRGAGLRPLAVELVRKLTYLDGDALLFSDFRTLVSHADSEAEAREWVAALTRTRAVVAYLRVGPEDDYESLRRYWSAGFRRRDSLPMLDSQRERANGGRLDIAHLLPPLPRRLLYSYPTPDVERTGTTPNCHWTTLNFFNYTPQELYLDLRLAASRVLGGYEKTKEAPTFGDALLFLDANGNAVHSCVFIADELVFTKNGSNSATPWILAPLKDVKQIYLRHPGMKIEVYRRRWPVSS